jgi:DNA-binding MarR family transcriptional regulator
MPEVFDLIGSLARRMERLESQALGQANLTAAQYMILANLHAKDGRPLGELADVMRCSRSTVTGVVDTMERKGLVAREANPADRRSHLLRLTQKGRTLRRSTPELEASFQSCGSCLDSQEFGRLRDLLSRLDDAMSAMGVGP